MKFGKAHWSIIFVAICLAYILLRFWRLTDSCLWFDEIFTVHAAEHEWSSLFNFVAQDLIHPPLFYVLLKIWIAVAGESLFWLRFFPIFFSILALAPFYLFCHELKLSKSTIAIAVCFLAVNGALIKYSQEVRMYSLLFCLTLFSSWLFARFFNYGKSLTAVVIVNILLVYTHYYGWFVVFAEIITILVLQKTKVKQILLMFALTLLAFVPWIYAIWEASKINSDVAQNIGWMSRPNLRVIFQFILAVFEPLYYQQSNDQAISRFSISIPILLIISAAKILYLRTWKNENDKYPLYLLSIFIATPVFLAFAVSWLMLVSIWGTRHLIIVFAPISILAAIFLTEIKTQSLKNIFFALIFFLFFIAFILQIKSGQPKFIWCGWENLSSNIDVSKPEKVYVFEDLTAYHFWFSLRENKQIQVIKVRNVKGLEEDTAYFLPRGFNDVKTVDENGMADEDFWIAFRDQNWSESKPPVSNLIEKGYKISAPKIFEVKGLKAFLVKVEKDSQ